MVWRTALLAIAWAQSFLGKYYYFDELQAELEQFMEQWERA